VTVAPGPWIEDQLSHLYGLFYGEMSLCGCGRPGEAIALVGRLLNLAPFYDHISEVAGVFGGNAGVQHIVLSVMDEAGLIEHGGSISGSWATVKGRAVRHLLSLGTGSDLDDALHGVGYPHSGEPCPGDCWAAWAPPEVDGDE
jgi:hypothetical protein